MNNTKELGIIMGMISRLFNEVQMIKAQNHVILNELSKSDKVKFEDLLKEVEKQYAIYVVNNLNPFDDLINKACDSNPDESF